MDTNKISWAPEAKQTQITPCFQRMIPIPNMPPLRSRKRRRPRNMMKANVRSLANKIMRAIFWLSMLGGLQPEMSDPG